LKVVKNLEEFYKYNDKDLDNILNSKFKNIIKYYSSEDLKFEIYERLFKKKYIENYRPFEIVVDDETKSWYVKPSHAKFSTYICKFVFNYIFAYYNKVNPDNLCVSLDDFNDSNYSEERRSRIKFESSYNPFDEVDFGLETDSILEELEERTKNKGTLVLDSELEIKIVKFLEQFGKEGCSEKNFLKCIFNTDSNLKNLTGLEQLIFKNIESIEKKGLFKKVNDGSGEFKYVLDNPQRRSLFNLFKYYVDGFKDKEISEEFKVTVAGVGAMKRSLRKELNEIKEEMGI
jgi:hypothetical protein